VAAEAGISRQCLSKWKNRYNALGEGGLLDRSSAPWVSPARLDAAVVAQIEVLRRERKWSARRIAIELNSQGVTVSATTVGRWLVRLGLNQRRYLDPAGDTFRIPRRITTRHPGHMVHDPS
jgi:transposase